MNAQSANLSADGTYAGQTPMDVLRFLQGGMAGAQTQNPAGVQLDDRKVKLISKAKDANEIVKMRRYFLKMKEEGKMDSAVVSAYLQKLDARSVELGNMPSTAPPPPGVDAATAATLNRGQARGAGSSGGARDAGSAGDARGGWASSATRIGDPTGIPAGYGWRQSLSQDQLRLFQFAQNQQTAAATEETGAAAGFTFDAEEASQSPAPPTGHGARADVVDAEIDTDVVDEVRDDPHVDRQKWKSLAVKDVLRATSCDKDAAVKVIIVLTSLAHVDESVAVDFVKTDSVRALSVEEMSKLSKSVVDELRLLDKDARKAVKRKTSNNVSSADLSNLVDVVWPPTANEKVTRDMKARRKEAAQVPGTVRWLRATGARVFRQPR